MPRKLCLFIAASLDGYIARGDGDISFLSMVEAPPEDYGYSRFIQTVDTVIMGRKTYEKVLSFGGEFPHADRKCYVLSKTKTGPGKQVEFYNGSPASLVRHLLAQPGRDIFCDGGSEIIHELMKEQLFDRFIISVIPCLLGSGIPLLKAGYPELTLKLVRAQTYPSGLVQLEYQR